MIFFIKHALISLISLNLQVLGLFSNIFITIHDRKAAGSEFAVHDLQCH